MADYRRLISYIYEYEGKQKGKNVGFAKLEARNGQCRINVNVKRIYMGGNAIGVYLLGTGGRETFLGNVFVRGGNGEFRAVVNCENIEGSGCNMEECCGLTLHETDSAWRAYTTIWEDAVAHAAEVDLADVTAEKVREQEAEKEEATRKLAENVSGEVNSASVGKEKLDEFLFSAYSRALSPHLYGNKERQTVSLDELKQQIGKLDLQKKNDLLSLCDIAGLVAQGDVNQLVSKVEENAATLTGNDLSSMLMAFGAMRDKATKADYNRMVAAAEKMMANPANSEMKNYLEYYVESWKNLAHVGVNFQDLTFEQAVEKAAKMRKQIFVDCYTSWCGPCKYMSNTVFPQEKMGDYMNPKFICVKYDMEKGEGPELAKKFGVRAYPTFVILNTDGTVRHKFVGGGEPDRFIERVKDAFDDNKATGVLDAKYAEGARDKEFLAKYVESLISMYSPDASKVAAELYGQLTDEEKVSADYWFIFNNPDLAPAGSEAYEYLLANREKFAQNNTEEAVDKRLSIGYQRKLMMIFYGRDKSTTAADLDQMKKEIVGLKLKNEKSLVGQINIAKALLANNPNQLLTVCEKEVNNLSPEEFPFSIIAGAKEKATPLQINRWKKIGQKLVAKCEDKDMAKQMEQYIESMFAKK